MESNFLFILLEPLLAIILLAFIPSYYLRGISLAISYDLLIRGLFLCFGIESIQWPGFWFFSQIDFWPLSLRLGLDGISFFFFLLTLFLLPICILTSWEYIEQYNRKYYILLYSIIFCVLLAFSVLDLFWFYISFESVLIPMFLLIGIWGSRVRKINAAYQFFLYTLAGSIFMFLSLLFIYFHTGTTSWDLLVRIEFEPWLQKILWFCFFCSFAVKIPMLPVHVWLPEAHVEAPTAGSVLLAGVLLKLGTYGFLRFSFPFFPSASEYFTPFLMTLALISVIYSSCTTLRQIDLKKAIAYSSVAHMNLVVLGLTSYVLLGLSGGLNLMLSHGFVSSGLFLCVGCLYDRYKTRLISYYGGLISLMPIFGIIFFVFTLANMGFPGTSSFIGEFLIFLSLTVSNPWVSILSISSVVLSAGYALWLYNRVMFGTLKDNINYYSDINERELLLLLLILLPVFWFGIFPNSILYGLEDSCMLVLYLMSY